MALRSRAGNAGDRVFAPTRAPVRRPAPGPEAPDRVRREVLRT